MCSAHTELAVSIGHGYGNEMRLEDKFDIVKRVGEGQFGRVLLIRDKATGVHLAAKVLKGRVTNAARQRFLREVKQLQRYSQQHVIPVLDVHIDAERPFFTMPLATASLNDWAGKMNAKQIAVAMLRVMDALAAVHADGGFHRDIKPQNLLLMSKGETVVGDFGLGNNPNVTKNFTRGASGTVNYMAPELLTVPPAPFAPACDVYSAGATWYHLVTGRVPAVAACPLDPRAVVPSAEPWMAEWIGAMTRREPAQRPTALQAANALRLRTQPATAPQPQAITWTPTTGKDLLAVGLVFGILALIIKGTS